MLIYILIYFYYGLYAFLSDNSIIRYYHNGYLRLIFNNPYIIFTLLFVPLIILTTFREQNVAPDFTTYKYIYDTIISGDYINVEPITVLLAHFSWSFRIFLFLYALFALTIKFYSIYKLSVFPVLSILFYYCHFYFLHEMTQIRIGLAVGLILLMIYYLCNGKKRTAILLWIVAVFIHYSTLICVIFFLINCKTFYFKKYILFILGGLIVAILNLNLINLISLIPFGGPILSKVIVYQSVMTAGAYTTINIFNTQFLIQIITGALLIILNNRKMGNKYTLILTKVYLMGIALYLYFSSIPVFAFRISEIFFSTEYILIPQLLLLFKPKRIAWIGIGIYSFLIFYLYIFILKLVSPYNYSI